MPGKMFVAAIVTFVVCAIAGVASGRANWVRSVSASESVPQLLRHEGDDGADAPSGRLLLRVPAENEGSNDTPPVEDNEPPAEPGDDYHDEEGGPSFDGEDNLGNEVLFVIDVSDSMLEEDGGAGEDWDGNVVSSMSRLIVVKTELVECLRQVDENFRFDIIWLAGGNVGNCQPPNTDAFRGELVQCTNDVRTEAIETVKNQHTWFGTPWWEASKRALTGYPDTIETLLCYTDGAPFPRNVAGDWGDNQVPAVLRDFPMWYANKKANGCRLIVFVAGNNSAAGSFAQDLCAQNDGKYIHQ